MELPAGVTLRCTLTFPLHGIEPHHFVTSTIADLRAGRNTVLEKALTLLAP